jgi:ABC-type sulfate/molybdate transport systems ATPase subunit
MLRRAVGRLRIEALRARDTGPIDLVVEAGECVAISGRSGSGKTVLLRALADLDAHEGRLFLDDDECDAVAAPLWRRRVGLLPTESAWWHETVTEHLAKADAFRLEALGLKPEVLKRSVSRLSSGERQRLALLRLLAQGPEALLLDEPTAHLDAHHTARVEALVASCRGEDGMAVLWVTHDPEQARSVAARCFRLEQGRLVSGSPA